MVSQFCSFMKFSEMICLSPSDVLVIACSRRVFPVVRSASLCVPCCAVHSLRPPPPPLSAMNIPRAYDALPSQQQQQQQGSGAVTNGHGPSGAAAYGSHLSSLVAVDSGDAHQSLLLNEQEAQWQQEMAQEGIGHLPVSWYRQTPRQALTSLYGVANIIVSMAVNFGQAQRASGGACARGEG